MQRHAAVITQLLCRSQDGHCSKLQVHYRKFKRGTIMLTVTTLLLLAGLRPTLVGAQG